MNNGSIHFTQINRDILFSWPLPFENGSRENIDQLGSKDLHKLTVRALNKIKLKKIHIHSVSYAKLYKKN